MAKRETTFGMMAVNAKIGMMFQPIETGKGGEGMDGRE
jgi:hypothetical protein